MPSPTDPLWPLRGSRKTVFGPGETLSFVLSSRSDPIQPASDLMVIAPPLPARFRSRWIS